MSTERAGVRLPALEAEQTAAMLKKLDELRRDLERVHVAIDEVRAVLTPCYGEKDGRPCVYPDRHRGPHLSPEGDEWVDDE